MALNSLFKHTPPFLIPSPQKVALATHQPHSICNRSISPLIRSGEREERGERERGREGERERGREGERERGREREERERERTHPKAMLLIPPRKKERKNNVGGLNAGQIDLK